MVRIEESVKEVQLNKKFCLLYLSQQKICRNIQLFGKAIRDARDKYYKLLSHTNGHNPSERW